MREPPAAIKFLGHPLVSVPVMGLCGLVIYGWSQNPGAIIPGAGAVIGLVWTANAQKTMAQYRSWRRAWNSMAEPIPRRPLGQKLVGLLTAALVIGGFVAAEAGLFAGSADDLAAMGLIGAALLVVGLAVRWIARRGRMTRARSRAQRECVAVVIRRPILPAPQLKDAYRALPQHCWQAIDAGWR